MLTKRIIPCFDVDNGRVVKGVSFVELRDAGDPVELAKLYDAQGADELVFLDITASSDNRTTTYDMVARTADEVFIPFTVGGGVRSDLDVRVLLELGADKGVAQQRCRSRSGSRPACARSALARSASSSPSMRSRPARDVGGLHARRAQAHRAGRRGVGEDARSSWAPVRSC